jgi:F0F1-type ATP synthase membrane subunit c/vacuolar-type H+-ATPase subunit K
MLLGLHEMMVLSALKYGSAAYGSASNAQLKRPESVHNKGLRLALGAFCVCITVNIMCESGFESLAERRKRKIINTAIHVAENISHPVNR